MTDKELLKELRKRELRLSVLTTELGEATLADLRGVKSYSEIANEVLDGMLEWTWVLDRLDDETGE